MSEIVNFPDTQGNLWDAIQRTVSDALEKNGAPTWAREEIIAWAKALYFKHSVPHTVVTTPEEARQFYELLQQQKIAIFFEALNQKILTYRA